MSARLARVLTALSLLLVFGLGPAAAQDLAAAARKARADRAKKHAPAAPSYTEDDLASKRSKAEDAEPEATPGSTSKAAPVPHEPREEPGLDPGSPEGPPSTSVVPHSAEEAKPDGEEQDRAQQEAYWHKRMQDARSRVERAEANLEKATQYAGRSMGFTGRHALRLQAAAQERVEKAQKELDEARQELDDLPDEARRAGAMPGWLR